MVLACFYMARTKGTKNYPDSIKTKIAEEHKGGETIHEYIH